MDFLEGQDDELKKKKSVGLFVGPDSEDKKINIFTSVSVLKMNMFLAAWPLSHPGCHS